VSRQRLTFNDALSCTVGFRRQTFAHDSLIESTNSLIELTVSNRMTLVCRHSTYVNGMGPCECALKCWGIVTGAIE
jgi:hypothetical protein